MNKQIYYYGEQMRISDHTAKMIVEKLKDVIDYDLNFLTKKDILFIPQIQIELALITKLRRNA